MKKFLLLILVCACFYPVLGDVGHDLTTFFNKLGGQSGISYNVSNPGAYQDQTAGYYTGGNIFAIRCKHHSLRPSNSLTTNQLILGSRPYAQINKTSY